MLLAFDLAAADASLALGAGPRLEPIAERAFAGTRGRSLIAEADAALRAAGAARADLRGLVVGTGPGSYTGLRVACAAARALAWALRIPCGGVASFAAAAFAAPPGAPVHLLLDAFRGEVYHAAYERAGRSLRVVAAPAVCAPERLGERVPVGARVLGDARFVAHEVEWLGARTAPSAAQLLDCAAALGARADGAGVAALGPAAPLYLRPAAFRPGAA